MSYEADPLLDQSPDAEDILVSDPSDPSDPSDLSDLSDPDALLALLDNPNASLREQAFALYCRGLRSSAIAAALGVTARTVRRWLTDMRTLVAAEAGTDRAAELLRAIESHRAIAAAAWDAYEHEREMERQILRGELDHIRRRARHVGGSPHIHPPAQSSQSSSSSAAAMAATDDYDETVLEEVDRPRIPQQGARLLAVALAAQREVARLQGLYDHLPPERPPVHILISQETTGEDGQPTTVTYGQTPSSPLENLEKK